MSYILIKKNLESNFIFGCGERTQKNNFVKKSVIVWKKRLEQEKRKSQVSLIFQAEQHFDQDNIATYKLIRPKCRSSNAYTVCSC